MVKCTYDELLVPDRVGEVPIERNSEVIGIVSLVRDDMLQESCLVSKNLCEASARSTDVSGEEGTVRTKHELVEGDLRVLRC